MRITETSCKEPLPITQLLFEAIGLLKGLYRYHHSSPPELPSRQILIGIAGMSAMEFPETQLRLKQVQQILLSAKESAHRTTVFALKRLDPLVTVCCVLCDKPHWVSLTEEDEYLAGIQQVAANLGSVKASFYPCTDEPDFQQLLAGLRDEKSQTCIVCDWRLTGQDYDSALELMSGTNHEVRDFWGSLQSELRQLILELQPHDGSPVDDLSRTEGVELVSVQPLVIRAIELIQTVYECRGQTFPRESLTEWQWDYHNYALGLELRNLIEPLFVSPRRDNLLAQIFRIQELTSNSDAPVFWLHRGTSPLAVITVAITHLSGVPITNVADGILSDADFPSIMAAADWLAKSKVQYLQVPGVLRFADLLAYLPMNGALHVQCGWQLDDREWVEAKALFKERGATIENVSGGAACIRHI